MKAFPVVGEKEFKSDMGIGLKDIGLRGSAASSDPSDVPLSVSVRLSSKRC